MYKIMHETLCFFIFLHILHNPINKQKNRQTAVQWPPK